jgi:hypothetical protein
MKATIQRKVVLALVSAAWWQGCAFAQNLIVNGGFDTDAAGWTASNNALGGYACCKGNPGGCFWLDSSPSPTTDPTVSQVVSGLIAGTSYAVSGDYAKLIDRGGGSASDFRFGVATDGVVRYESRQTDFAWHSFAFGFTATTQSTVLVISAQRNGTGVSYQIDNIVLQPVPSVAAALVGSNAALSWPTNALGFNVEYSTNMAAGTWTAVTNAPTIRGTNYTVSLTAQAGSRFFRLKQ